MGCIESRKDIALVPWTLVSLSRQEWLEWKSCLLAFINQKCIPPYKQANKFFKYSGYVGQQIMCSLYFQDSKDETKLEILLFKFDVYFIYQSLRKSYHQSIQNYIYLLEEIAKNAGINKNLENTIKEKILQNFKTENIFRDLKNMSLSASIINYERLNLHELAFLWNEHDKLSKKIIFCCKCAKWHTETKCSADGQKCRKCGGTNHFARCCSKSRNYIINCSGCGSDHGNNRCPAFSKKCSKCNGVNHFSWKCSSNKMIFQRRNYCNFNCSSCRYHKNNRPIIFQT